MKKYTNINIDVEATQYTEEKEAKLIEKYMGQGIVRNIEFPNLPGAVFIYNSTNQFFYLNNNNLSAYRIYINYFILFKDYKYSIVDPDTFNSLYEKKEDDEIPNLYTNKKTIVDTVQVTQEMFDGFIKSINNEGNVNRINIINIDGIGLITGMLTISTLTNLITLHCNDERQLTVYVNDFIIYNPITKHHSVATEEAFLKQFTPVENG